MVTFECKETDCTQKDMAINFLGEIAEAECGGCGITLTSFDLREDPELPEITTEQDAD
jgi:hypothetical protein